MKQTAVEWLVEQITNGDISARQAIQQAKEMEREQIIEAYNTSFLLRDKPYSTAEKYYKQTYESKTNI
jgi:vacuolar-type H+-ATPase subunit H